MKMLQPRQQLGDAAPPYELQAGGRQGNGLPSHLPRVLQQERSLQPRPAKGCPEKVGYPRVGTKVSKDNFKVDY